MPGGDDVASAAAAALAQGETPWLVEIRDDYANRERQAVAKWIRSSLGHQPATALERFLSDRPAALSMVPGAAGVHLTIDHPQREPMLRAYTAELAAEAGEAIDLELDPCTRIVFPMSGIRVESPGSPEVARLSTVTQGTILLRWRKQESRVLSRPASATVAVSADDVACAFVGMERVEGIKVDVAATLDLEHAPAAACIRSPGPLHDREGTRIRGAVRLLALVGNGMLDEMKTGRLCLVPLVSRPGLARQSFSVQAVPRVVYCALDEPLELADVICHEYHHLKLFLVEERYQMENPRAATVVPWRADRRTARGLLHGTYVFFNLARMFQSLFDRFPASRNGVRRLMILRVAIESAAELVTRTDWKPTSFGTELLRQIRAENGLELDRMTGTDRELAQWTRRVVADHVRQAGSSDSAPPRYFG